MIRTSRVLPVLAMVFAFLAPAALAQPLCFLGPDGFDTGCCNQPNPNLANRPSLQFAANWGCYNNCTPSPAIQAQVQLGGLSHFFCDYATLPINATVAGVGVFNGLALAKYSRTWTEPSAGAVRQVWRYLLNVDFQVQTPAILPPPVCAPPEAYPPFNQVVHMTGHVDYICDPSTVAGSLVAISLSRLPGCIQFAPFSQQPIPALAGTNTTFHLVGPAPFIFMPIPEPNGPILAEAVRPSRLTWAPFNYQCISEVRVQQGNLITNQVDCLCNPAVIGPAPWKHQILNGATCCNGALFPFNSVPVPAIGLPTGFTARTLGRWGAGAGILTNRELTFYFGLIQYNDPCTPNPALINLHAVTGVGSGNHVGQLFPSSTTSCPIIAANQFTNFIDLQNMHPIAQSFALGNSVPGVGGLFASSIVWNLNTP